MIRTLLFDLGNVLVNFSYERMCRQIGALAGLDGAQVHAALFDNSLMLPLDRGEIDGAEFQRRLEQRLGAKFEREALEQAASDIFTLNAPMRPVLDQLRHRGYRLVLLSNTCPAHVESIRRQWDVLAPFHSLVLSYQVGAAKPEEAIYQRALEEIHCDPDECFYTDDVPAYVSAGRRIGLQAEVFTDSANFTRHLRERGVTLG